MLWANYKDLRNLIGQSFPLTDVQKLADEVVENSYLELGNKVDEIIKQVL